MCVSVPRGGGAKLGSVVGGSSNKGSKREERRLFSLLIALLTLLCGAAEADGLCLLPFVHSLFFAVGLVPTARGTGYFFRVGCVLPTPWVY